MPPLPKDTVAASHAQECIPSGTSACLLPSPTHRCRLAGTCAGMHVKRHTSVPPPTHTVNLAGACTGMHTKRHIGMPPTHAHTVTASLVHAQACIPSGTSACLPHTHTPSPPRWFMHRHACQAAHRHVSHTCTHFRRLAGTELPGSRLRHTHMPFAAAALADRHAGKGISVAPLPCCGHTLSQAFPSAHLAPSLCAWP